LIKVDCILTKVGTLVNKAIKTIVMLVQRLKIADIINVNHTAGGN